MSKLTLPIEVGKKYVTRGGKVVTARERYSSYNRNTTYIGKADVAENLKDDHCWTDTGKIHPQYNYREHPNDLVADYEIGHVHAEAMLQYAQDAALSPHPYSKWQYKHKSDKNWVTCTTHPCWTRDIEYRRKAKMVVNNIEVNKGLSHDPVYDTIAYLAKIDSFEQVHSFRWAGTAYEIFWREKGLVFDNRADAKAMAEALLGFEKS